MISLDPRAVALLALSFLAVAALLQAVWLLFGSRWQRARRVMQRWRNFESHRIVNGGVAGTRVSTAASRGRWRNWRIFRGRRLARIEPQLADAVELVARALRAGHGLPHALRMLANEGPQPLAEEFSVACDQIGFGVPVDEALRALADRIASDDLRCFVIAVVLQRETGGNLGETLDKISALIRQRQRLRQMVRALSAEGRMSAWILGLLPFGLAGAIGIINPALLSVLWTDPAGRAMSAASLSMMIAGLLAMRRIVRVRI